MKTKFFSILLLLLVFSSSNNVFCYESFSHSVLLLPHEPNISEPWVKVITTQEDWESFFYSTMATITYPTGQAPVAPVINFDDYQIITGGLGIKPSSGYSVVVDKIIETEDTLYINILSVSPGTNCVNFAAMTHPSVAILVKKNNKTKNYTINSVVNHCE